MSGRFVAAFAMVALVIVGIQDVNMPFDGDQALFALGAMRLHSGAVLYRDFWDIKQPGIYWFYLTAGSLFGFSERGIHEFELLYFLVFAVVLAVTLQSYYRTAISAAIAPFFAIGGYFALATPWLLTQLEALVTFPLYTLAWTSVKGAESAGTRRALWFLGSGISAAIVAAFKLFYLPIAFAIWAVLLAPETLRSRRRSVGQMMYALLPALAGVVVPLAILWAAFAPVVGSDLLVATMFTDPPAIARAYTRYTTSNLRDAIIWLGRAYGIPLLIGVIAIWRDRRLRANPLTVVLATWIVAGICAFAAQVTSWYTYQMELIVVPIALLGIAGLESLFGDARATGDWRRAGIWIAAAACGLVYVAHIEIEKIVLLARDDFGRTAADRYAYRADLVPSYKAARSETEFLHLPSSRTGSIYVIGNPIYYRFADRDQAIAMNGWSWGIYLPEQWLEIEGELSRTRPPYVFLTGDARKTVKINAAAMLAFIRSHYRPLHEDRNGEWFVLREASS